MQKVLNIKHWPKINAVERSNVLVPLCGKSLDMLWLAEQGYTIVGLEMVKHAVEAFFIENHLDFHSVEYGKHRKYSSQPFTIFQGDFFLNCSCKNRCVSENIGAAKDWTLDVILPIRGNINSYTQAGPNICLY